MMIYERQKNQRSYTIIVDYLINTQTVKREKRIRGSVQGK